MAPATLTEADTALIEKIGEVTEDIRTKSVSVALHNAYGSGDKQALARDLAALISLARQSAGDGWVTVPAKSTPEIVEAMRLCTIRNSRPADPKQPFESPWECAVALFLPAPPTGGSD